MPEKKGARLDFDERWEIEDMLKESSPFREIARKLGVSPTTVSSEVKLNRAFFKPKAMQSRTLRRRPNSASCRSACRCRLRHGRSMRDKAHLVAVPVLRAARLRLRLRLKAARVRAVRLREVQKARRTAPSRRCSTSPLAPRRLTTRACAAYAGIACEPS